jgi:hypothetical protein
MQKCRTPHLNKISLCEKCQGYIVLTVVKNVNQNMIDVITVKLNFFMNAQNVVKNVT